MAKRMMPRIEKVSRVSAFIGVALSVLALALVVAVLYKNYESDVDHDRHFECLEAADQLMRASDDLTAEARMFVTTARRPYAEAYVQEAYVDKNRDAALETLSSNTDDQEAINSLKLSLSESKRLSETELYAMHLVADAEGMKNMPDAIMNTKISDKDAKLTAEKKEDLAEELVLNDDYRQSKDTIIMGVESCTSKIIAGLAAEEDSTDATRTLLLACLAVMVVLLVALILNTAAMNGRMVVGPIHDYINSIEDGEPLSGKGSEEMCQMADSYNIMYEENHQRTKVLEQEARTDALTGLLNRGSYDKLLEQNKEDVALILFDIDYFKLINDANGHEVGDEVIKRVASSISDHFRASDYACRIGGDEFGVIMTKMRNVSKSIVERKIKAIADDLDSGVNGLPAVTLSVGVAFSDQVTDGESIYRAADHALYHAKEEGRNRASFFEG